MFEQCVKYLEIKLGRFNSLRVYVKRLMRIVCQILAVFPIKNNQILFKAYSGVQYSCNPKYICEYLLDKHPDELKIVWAFRSPDHYKYLQSKGIKAIRWLSLYYLYILATSKVIVSNVGGDSALPRRKGQIFIETWHGSGAYKKGDKNTAKRHQQDAQLSLSAISIFLSGAKSFEKYLIRETLELKDIPVLSVGCPRNDIFFNKDKIAKASSKIHKQFSIPSDCGIVLYAPTYRNDLHSMLYEINFSLILEMLERRFHRKFVFGVRLHYIFSKTYFKGKELSCIDFSAYDDMQELLCASDVLITDYSSCMWDFSLMYRPCFIYATDVDKYIQERDFFTPMDKWPFLIAHDNDELAQNIMKFNEEDYVKRVQEHHKELGCCETGHAAQIVGDLIYDICTGKKNMDDIRMELN